MNVHSKRFSFECCWNIISWIGFIAFVYLKKPLGKVAL